MAQCARCGAVNDPRAASCVRCGTTLGAALPGGGRDEERPDDTDDPSRAQTPTPPQSSRPPHHPRRPHHPPPSEDDPRPPEEPRPRAPEPPVEGPRRPRAAQSVTPPKRSARAPVPRRGDGTSLLRVILPLVAGVGVVLLLQTALGTAIPSGNPLFRLFRPSGGWIMAVVPTFILFALAWTSTDLLLLTWPARRVSRDLRRPEIRQLPEIVGREPFHQTLQRLEASNRGLLDRRAGQRVAWLLHHLEGVDPRRGHELLRHRSDLDASAAAATFRPVNLLVVGMPLMGLVGTVLGIGIAAGGFSESLAANANVDAADRVTTGLAEIASGLAFAFDTLLFGLLAGVVAGVVAAAIRARDARTLAAIDELSLEMVAQIPGGPMRGGVGSAGHAESRDLDRLEAQAERLMAAIDTGIEGLTHAVADMRIGVTGLGDRVRRIEDANRDLADSMGEFGDGIRSFRDAQTALTPVLRRLSGPLELTLTPIDSAKDGARGDGQQPEAATTGERRLTDRRTGGETGP